MIRDNITYKFLTDQVGSVRMVVNMSTGIIEQKIKYTAFGHVLEDSNPGFQPFGFAGGLYDSDSGFVRFGARDYDPYIGRWTAKDPIHFDGGQINLYVYVGNDPVNRIDPEGKVVHPLVFAIGTALSILGYAGLAGSFKCLEDCMEEHGYENGLECSPESTEGDTRSIQEGKKNLGNCAIECSASIFENMFLEIDSWLD